MYKKLKLYYLHTAVPFVLLLIAAYYFRGPVLHTIETNPHPQINFAIFAAMVVGAIAALWGTFSLIREAKKLAEFSEAVKEDKDVEELQEMALAYNADIAYVLRMIAASKGRAITHQEQIAIEHELDKAAKRLAVHAALPQFLTGLLVGLGLLGTFVGLLATLGDISDLIGSFGALDISTANPIDVFRGMVTRMKAPMTSMAIAFSASMYGLLGSITLGFMGLGMKRCMGDIMYKLSSEVAQHIEMALAREGFVYSRSGRKKVEMTMGLEALIPKRDETMPGAALVKQGGVSEDLMADLMKNGPRRGSEGIALGGSGEFISEEIRILRRIEERLTESSRLQERSLTTEIDQFNKQRGEMFKVMSEHADAVGQFRSELQRVGRQLGTILGIMERGNAEILQQMNDHFSELTNVAVRQTEALKMVSDRMARMSDDAAEARGVTVELLGAIRVLLQDRAAAQGNPRA